MLQIVILLCRGRCGVCSTHTFSKIYLKNTNKCQVTSNRMFLGVHIEQELSFQLSLRVAVTP